MKRDFSKQIKSLRKALGLTQTALAQKLGVLPWAVASWEQGRFEPSGEHYAQLARLAPPAEAQYFFSKLGIDRAVVLSAWPELANRGRPLPDGGRKPGRSRSRRKLESVDAPEIRIYTTAEWKNGTED